MTRGLVLGVALLACSGPSATSSHAPPPAVPVAHEILPDVAFDQLDRDQRAEFMKQKVVPAMGPIFASRVQLSCETCHGKPVDGHYVMPNPELPKLGSDLSKWKREDLEWMAKQVKPTMAKLLGRPEWTPDRPTGFGCSVCHTVEP